MRCLQVLEKYIAITFVSINISVAHPNAFISFYEFTHIVWLDPCRLKDSL
jgi:hypothetical protein